MGLELGNGIDTNRISGRDSPCRTATCTTAEVQISFNTIEYPEKIAEMGFKEGFAAAHSNLDDLLKK
jgi:hypothetical protein